MCGVWIDIWLGTSVEDQKRADERIPALLSIPARVRFLSAEPLLGPVDLTPMEARAVNGDLYRQGIPDGVNLVICGGESGPGCRPMELAWAESLRDQCAAAGVAFWMKQLGGHPNKRHLLTDLPAGLRARELPIPPSAEP